MNALVYRIQAEAPLLMTGLMGDPNSSVSYPYVPGSAIRGALVNRHKPGGIQKLAEADADRRLFFGENVRFLNAYPLDRKGGRTLPTPLSWVYDKHTSINEGTPIEDVSSDDTTFEEPKGIGIDRPFCWLDGAAVEFYRPEMTVSVHTARERVKGRATPAEGAVFRYEAIAAGEQFGGAILSSDAQQLETLKALLLRGDLWIGGSRSGSYGHIRVRSADTQPFPETPVINDDLGPADALVLTLLSNTILRTREGTYSDVLVPEFLPASLREAITPEPVRAFKRVADLGGFNRRWGLPLDQATAVLAGSVFVYDVVRPIAAATLQELQEEGIGERRLDGFGRVGVNWHCEHAQITVREIKPTESPDTVILTGDSQVLAQAMTLRWLRQDLDRLLADHIQKLGGELSRIPSRAQLSRLRVVALNALPERDIWRLLAFFFDGNLKSVAREQYLAARVDSIRMLDWLTALLLNALSEAACKTLHARLAEAEEASRTKKQPANELDDDIKRFGKACINGTSLTDLLKRRLDRKENSIWRRSIWDRLSDTEIPVRKLGNIETRLTDELAQEYTIRLIAGLLHRATKEIQE